MKDSYGTYDGRRPEPPYETGGEAMSDRDKYDEIAERLLPCEWTLIGQRDCSLIDKSSCITCERRPAIAAELRKSGERAEKLEAALEHESWCRICAEDGCKSCSKCESPLKTASEK